jgi:hypothetical protein
MDLQEWSKSCLKYYEYYFLAERYFQNTQLVLRYLAPEYKPQSLETEKLMDKAANHSVFVKSMRYCSNHINDCNDPYLLKEFWIGLLTKADITSKEYVENLQRGMDMYAAGSAQSQATPKRRLLKALKAQQKFRRNRVLEFKADPYKSGVRGLYEENK